MVARWTRGAAALALAAAVGMAGCGGNTTQPLKTAEDALGLATAPIWPANSRPFHHALLDAAGFGMRWPGYVVSIEKTSLLEGNHLIFTHAIRYRDRERDDGHDFPRPCILRTRLAPQQDEIDRAERVFGKKDWGLFEVCDKEPNVGYTDDTLRKHVASDLATGHYTHVFVIVMGWNTDQTEAIRNYNAIVSNLAVEARGFAKARFNPLVIGVTWPSQWTLDANWAFVPEWLVRGLSFGFKEASAREVGKNFVVPMIERSILAGREDARATDSVPLTMIGHSFGALALATAMAEPGGPKDGRYTARDKVVLLQGAVDFEELFERNAPPGTKARLAGRLGAQPFRISMTASRHDTAVATAL